MFKYLSTPKLFYFSIPNYENINIPFQVNASMLGRSIQIVTTDKCL